MKKKINSSTLLFLGCILSLTAQDIKSPSESLQFGVEKKGSGAIIYMVDNPLYRSFWEGGKLFFTNALFMVNSDEIKSQN